MSNRKKEKMPDFGFRLMTIMYNIMDLFYTPEKHIQDYGIKEGYTVVDYGCGPGRYVRGFSALVGESGTVYAVDIHNLAIENVKKRIHKYSFGNVTPLLANGYSCPLEKSVADMIFCLDMFHQVNEPTLFFRELHRILKPNGTLILEDGHQPRVATIDKINGSMLWEIIKKTKKHVRCVPK